MPTSSGMMALPPAMLHLVMKEAAVLQDRDVDATDRGGKYGSSRAVVQNQARLLVPRWMMLIGCLIVLSCTLRSIARALSLAGKVGLQVR